MSDTFVVIWRHSKRGRWQVQPYIHSSTSADQVGRKLIDQYGGEVWVLPVEIPPAEGEDARD